MDLLRDMSLFVELAKSRHFGRAAAALGLPPSTLSRRIAALEQGLGLRLFHRSTRRTELTEAGLAYFERCRLIVEEAEAAHDELRGRFSEPAGVIRVSMSVDYGLQTLAPLLSAFAQAHPGIELQLDLSARLADMLAEPVDLAIRMGPLPDSTLVARRLTEVHAGLYAAPDYLARAGTPRRPADLAQHACIRRAFGSSASSWTLQRRGVSTEQRVSGPVCANNMGMVMHMVRMGLGIGLLERGAAQLEVAAGRLQPVLPAWLPPAVPVSALTATRLLPLRVRLLLDFLAEKLA